MPRLLNTQEKLEGANGALPSAPPRCGLLLRRFWARVQVRGRGNLRSRARSRNDFRTRSGVRSWRGGRSWRRRHNPLRNSSQFIPYLRMSLQVVPKLGMARQELFVVRQRGIPGELLRQGSVSTQELTETGRILAVTVARARFPISRLLAFIETLLLSHESVRIFAKFLASFRGGLQKLLQRRVLLNKLLVLNQRGVLAELFRNFRMAVHEPIRVREFLAVDVAIPVPIVPDSIFVAVEPLLLPHEGPRVLGE